VNARPQAVPVPGGRLDRLCSSSRHKLQVPTGRRRRDSGRGRQHAGLPRPFVTRGSTASRDRDERADYLATDVDRGRWVLRRPQAAVPAAPHPRLVDAAAATHGSHRQRLQCRLPQCRLLSDPAAGGLSAGPVSCHPGRPSGPPADTVPCHRQAPSGREWSGDPHPGGPPPANTMSCHRHMVRTLVVQGSHPARHITPAPTPHTQ
jgi:hypothetical protein